jgi:putative ABC transport system permease protein
MSKPNTQATVFRGGGDAAPRRVSLPWKESLKMCWSSVRNRMGRFALIFMGIAVVVAFLMSTFTYQDLLSGLADSDDIHIQAALERAGIFSTDPEIAKRSADRKIWLIGLSCVLCFFGIANTMLMSVTERVSEIGTLKCLGALDRFIVRLMLIESLFIGLLGSIAGVLAGYALTLLQIGFAFEFAFLSFENCLPPLTRAAPAAVGVGAILTVLAAIYPTYVAAKMEPVDAMRAEV